MRCAHGTCLKAQQAWAGWSLWISGVRVFGLGKSNLVTNRLVEMQLSKNNDLIEMIILGMRVSHTRLTETGIGTTIVKAIWEHLSPLWMNMLKHFNLQGFFLGIHLCVDSSTFKNIYYYNSEQLQDTWKFNRVLF